MPKPIWWILRVFHHVLLFFIGVILRLMFVADGTFPPATAYCFLKVGNAPLSS